MWWKIDRSKLLPRLESNNNLASVNGVIGVIKKRREDSSQRLTYRHLWYWNACWRSIWLLWGILFGSPIPPLLTIIPTHFVCTTPTARDTTPTTVGPWRTRFKIWLTLECWGSCQTERWKSSVKEFSTWSDKAQAERLLLHLNFQSCNFFCYSNKLTVNVKLCLINALHMFVLNSSIRFHYSYAFFMIFDSW